MLLGLLWKLLCAPEGPETAAEDAVRRALLLPAVKPWRRRERDL